MAHFESKVEMAEEKTCAVVTGGRGFAARHLVEMLIKSQPKKWLVRIADLAPSIKLDPHEEDGILGNALRSGHAFYVSADLRHKAQVIQAFEGAEVVFHMAAPDSSINNYQLHHSVNVQGTENVIAACIACKVKRLIYTSSPSVVFDGIHGIYNGDESLPYPNTYNDSYSATKAQAEALVIQSNGKGGLLTCCIRPSSIFGPGDKLLVPSLVAAARAGKSKFIIGDGNNMYDFTYVENVAHAHVCAEQTLASGIAEGMAAGKAFFITNMEPIKFWEFVSLILEGLGYERPRIRIPVPFLMPIAHVVEWTYKMAAPLGMRVPQLTPSRVRLLSCSRTFNCTRAKNELGYTPIVSLQEGLERTIQSYSFLRADQPTEGSTARGLPSKASTYLGGGKVAYILLWKDKKQTLSILLSLFAVYFFTFGYTFITAVSKLLLTVTVVLFVHSILPAKVLDYRLEKIPNSYFQFSEETMHHIALSMRAAWNSAAQILDSLRRGKDWILFIKVVVVLSLINLIGEMPLQTLYLTGVFLIFTAFYLYDRREAEIDDLIQRAKSMLSLTVNQPAAAH